MRAIVFMLAALLLLNPGAAAQQQTAQMVAVPPTVRLNTNLRLDTESPAAGRYWATQVLEFSAVFVGEPWQAPLRPGAHMSRRSSVLVWVINPNAAPTSVRLTCRGPRGVVAFSPPAISIAAMSASGFAVRTEDLQSALGTNWCDVRADRPVLVNANLSERVSVGGGVHEETITPLQTWMLER